MSTCWINELPDVQNRRRSSRWTVPYGFHVTQSLTRAASRTSLEVQAVTDGAFSVRCEVQAVTNGACQCLVWHCSYSLGNSLMVLSWLPQTPVLCYAENRKCCGHWTGPGRILTGRGGLEPRAERVEDVSAEQQVVWCRKQKELWY